MMNSTIVLPKRQDKLELLELLQEKERRRALYPLKYAQQHQKQIEATESQRPIRTLFWGNRVGKTEWGGQEAARFATGNHLNRKIIVPNEGWAVCPSFDLQPESTQRKLEKYLSAQNDIGHVDYLRGNIWRSVRLKNGSLITFKTYEQGREKFQSAGKRWIWFDEEPPSDIYEECIVRQEAGIPLDIWITMTPVNGMTWIYDEIYMDPGNPLYYISDNVGWNDNIFLSEQQKGIMRAVLEKRGERIEVREKGRFMARVGLVCNWWRREKHLKEYKEFPKDWAYYEVLDGGWSDPASWLLAGIDLQGDIHIVDGFAESELLTEEIKKARDLRRGNMPIRQGFSDNDNPRLNKELSDLGMDLTPIEKKAGEQKSWDETMAEAMASFGKVQRGSGEPRLFINQNLTWLIAQIENLKWVENKRKDGIDVKPSWNAHRKLKLPGTEHHHHFDGVYNLAYLCLSLSDTKPDGNEKNTKARDAAKRIMQQMRRFY